MTALPAMFLISCGLCQAFTYLKPSLLLFWDLSDNQNRWVGVFCDVCFTACFVSISLIPWRVQKEGGLWTRNGKERGAQKIASSFLMLFQNFCMLGTGPHLPHFLVFLVVFYKKLGLFFWVLHTLHDRFVQSSSINLLFYPVVFTFMQLLLSTVWS